MDKTRPIDTSTLGRIAVDAPRVNTRLKLLEAVNALNLVAGANGTGEVYWTVTVLYNTVVYRRDAQGETHMHAVIEGVLK